MLPESKSDRRQVARPAAPGGPTSPLARWLEASALFVLLLVVAMRPLVTETYESARDPISQAIDVPVSLTPAATAGFDLAIWFAAAAAAVAAGRRRLAWRWTGLEIGWLFMLTGAVLSTVVASNKRLAINCSADWLTAAVLAAAMANLCRDRRRAALVLAVVVASGLTSAARCVMQKRFEYADTWQQYQQMKADFWRKQGVPLDDSRVDLYERRLRAREASGFLALSNAQGAGLALAGFAALAVMTLRSRGPAQRVVLALLAAILLSCIHATGSRGAMLAALLSLGLLAAVWHFREVLRRRWRPLLAAAWLAIAVAAAGVVVYGRSHGGLPGSSLNFRWQYWQVTRAIIADHFLVGVGAGNFDRVYLSYKPIAFPEEIKDPHNFLLSIFAQWGVLGAAGLAAALVGASAVAARCWGRGDEPDTREFSQTCTQSTRTEDLTDRRSLLCSEALRSDFGATQCEGASAFTAVLRSAAERLRSYAVRRSIGGYTFCLVAGEGHAAFHWWALG